MSVVDVKLIFAFHGIPVKMIECSFPQQKPHLCDEFVFGPLSALNGFGSNFACVNCTRSDFEARVCIIVPADF